MRTTCPGCASVTATAAVAAMGTAMAAMTTVMAAVVVMVKAVMTTINQMGKQKKTTAVAMVMALETLFQVSATVKT